MPFDPQDELISAYLDGELSADERAKVDQLLAASPEARQLYDDLRALRASFQTLPRHRLDEDFARRVLRRAERSMLGAPADGGITPAKDASDRAAMLRPLRSWRPWVWSAAAIAAALLLMLFNPARERDAKHLAQAPTEPSTEAGQPTPTVTELRRGPAVADSAAPADSLVKRDGERKSVEKAEVAAKEAAPAAVLAPAPASEALKTGAPLAKASAANKGSGQALANDAADSDDAFRARKDGAEQAANGLIAGAVGGQQLNQRGAFPDGVLFVQAAVSRKAAENRAFDKLLARNEIVYEDETEAAGATVAEGDRSGGEKLELEKAAGGKERSTGKDVAANQDARQKKSAAALDVLTNAEAASGNFEVIFVEATPEQIAATLADMGKQPDQFPAVVVTPTPGDPMQEPLSAYNYSQTPAREPASGETALTRPAQNADAKLPAEAPLAPAKKPDEEKRHELAQGAEKQLPDAGKSLANDARAKAADKPGLPQSQRSQGYASRLGQGDLNRGLQNQSRAVRMRAGNEQQLPAMREGRRSEAQGQGAGARPAAGPTSQLPTSQLPTSPRGALVQDEQNAAAHMRAVFVLQLAEPPAAELKAKSK